MDELYNRDFKGVWIPKEIWADGNLSMLEKVIAVEIDSLDLGDRGCFASNKYFAEFCGCSESAVSKAIAKLIDYGLIYMQSFNGRQRELKSRLGFSKDLPSKISEADSENLRHINIDNNTKNKTSSNNGRSAKRFTPPTTEEVREFCKEKGYNIDAEYFVDYYTANGWVQGKGKPVKDWKACVRTWVKNNYSSSKKVQSVPDYMTEHMDEKPKEEVKWW
jgi:signal recognition particle subunit SEC65